MEDVQRKATWAEDKLANSIEVVVRNEGHTLGNLLASELQEDPEVSFSAYKIPHPLESLMKLKVAVASTRYSPIEVLLRNAKKLRDEFASLRICVDGYSEEARG